jgi:TonB family protein
MWFGPSRPPVTAAPLLPHRSPPPLLPPAASLQPAGVVFSPEGPLLTAEPSSVSGDVVDAPSWEAVSSTPSVALALAPIAQPHETPPFDPDEPITIDIEALVQESGTARRATTIRRPAGLAALAASVAVIGLLWGLPGRTASSGPTAVPPDPGASATAAAADSRALRQTGDQDRSTSDSATDEARDRAEETQTPESSGALVAASRAAILVSRVEPQYPTTPIDSVVGSDVELDIDIDKNGRVSRALVVSGPGMLRDAAQAAVLQWRYQPALRNGVPAPSRRRVRVSFVPEP